MDRLTIQGKEYRVECNFNAISDYMTQKGETTLAFLEQPLSMQDQFTLMVCCINEGERLEGREHSYTAKDLGAGSMLATAEAIRDFLLIFSRQNGAVEEEDKPKKA